MKFIQHCLCHSENKKLTNLQVAPNFWQVWKEFEIKHGNEDTVREMLRIKRSVQAIYNTQVNFMSAQMLAVSGGKGDNAGEILLKRLENFDELLFLVYSVFIFSEY